MNFSSWVAARRILASLTKAGVRSELNLPLPPAHHPSQDALLYNRVQRKTITTISTLWKGKLRALTGDLIHPRRATRSSNIGPLTLSPFHAHSRIPPPPNVHAVSASPRRGHAGAEDAVPEPCACPGGLTPHMGTGSRFPHIASEPVSCSASHPTDHQ